MNCIDVSTTKLNERMNTSVLKHDSINVQSFSIGETLNTTTSCVTNKLNIICSVICDTSVL